MKKIVIYQESNPLVYLEDEDNSNISEYTKKISSILEANNVTILETTSGCLVVRPHKINSISIVEVDKIQTGVEPLQSGVQKLEVPDEEHEDVITDGD